MSSPKVNDLPLVGSILTSCCWSPGQGGWLTVLGRSAHRHENRIENKAVRRNEALITSPIPTISSLALPQLIKPETRVVLHEMIPTAARPRNFQYSLACTGGIRNHNASQII